MFFLITVILNFEDVLLRRFRMKIRVIYGLPRVLNILMPSKICNNLSNKVLSHYFSKKIDCSSMGNWGGQLKMTKQNLKTLSPKNYRVLNKSFYTPKSVLKSL